MWAGRSAAGVFGAAERHRHISDVRVQVFKQPNNDSVNVIDVKRASPCGTLSDH